MQERSTGTTRQEACEDMKILSSTRVSGECGIKEVFSSPLDPKRMQRIVHEWREEGELPRQKPPQPKTGIRGATFWAIAGYGGCVGLGCGRLVDWAKSWRPARTGQGERWYRRKQVQINANLLHHRGWKRSQIYAVLANPSLFLHLMEARTSSRMGREDRDSCEVAMVGLEVSKLRSRCEP